MGDKSAIEWTDATWNPTTGCDQVSPGCDNCYALSWAGRMKAMGQPAYQQDGDPRTSGPGFGLQMHEDRLDQPLRWTKPRRVFVDSMSDLFHPDVPDGFIARVFAVMGLADRHTFQILTKRHKRLRALLGQQDFARQVGESAIRWIETTPGGDSRLSLSGWSPEGSLDERCWVPPWPLPNVWLGVSVEDQERADQRIPALLETPAAVRFLSCEPLLGPVDLSTLGIEPLCPHGSVVTDGACYNCNAERPVEGRGLDWVIVGGESGPDARPMHPDWARSLRDQCRTAGVPFFFKQWGAWRPEGHHTPSADIELWRDGTTLDVNASEAEFYSIHADRSRWPVASMVRVGKKAAGRVLDGDTWDQFPADAGVPA